MNKEVKKLAQVIWDYMLLHQALKPVDCMVCLGSSDIRVASYAAKLFLEGLAPRIVFSGGRGKYTKDAWQKPEAEKFAEVAIELGVPEDKILIESESSNTGDNIIFTKKLLEAKGLHPTSILVVTKPYMERRAYAAFRKRWPEIEVVVTSPYVGFDSYANDEIPENLFISIMVGDLQRIKLYAEQGYQIPQDIPKEVWKAYERLAQLGYNKQVIKTQKED